MRYPASEKLEIIRLVERSHLPVRRTLDKLGIPATTFYRWYDRYRAFGQAGLEDRTSGPGRVWNRIPDDVRRQIVDLALDEPELSPRELAVTFTDTKGYFVSEASVYRLLAAAGSAGDSALGLRSGLVGACSPSRAAKYSRTGRLARCSSVHTTSLPSTRWKRLASASITEASTAKPSPATSPISMHRRTMLSNTWRKTSLSRKRP